jgi:hypothetical protein
MKKITKTATFRCCAILFLAFSSLLKVNAQTPITYTYDSNGNRLERTLGAKKSAAVSFPVEEKNIKPLEELTEFESAIKIYPNPTTGIIKVSIENILDQIKGELRIYNLNGIILKKLRVDSPLTEIDVNDIADGVYVMRLLINGKSLDYKIIKHN